MPLLQRDRNSCNVNIIDKPFSSIVVSTAPVTMVSGGNCGIPANPGGTFHLAGKGAIGLTSNGPAELLRVR